MLRLAGKLSLGAVITACGIGCAMQKSVVTGPRPVAAEPSLPRRYVCYRAADQVKIHRRTRMVVHHHQQHNR